jgi:hypothetical protein
MKAVELAVDEFKERLVKLEDRMTRVGLEQISGQLAEVVIKQEESRVVQVDKLKELSEDMTSRVAVGEAKCEEKIDVVSKEVDELKDRVVAFGVVLEDWKKEWPTPGESVSVGKEQKGDVVQSRSAKVSFAEKLKSKDTVVVIGDSLVRGVGQCLSKDSDMFTAWSKSGARIGHIVDEIGKLEDREDRHLVVMVGTNHIKYEGSEVVLKDYRTLIEQCKVKKSRVVTVVGIPKRFDLNSLQENRRFAVNRQLEKLCREHQVHYLSYEPGAGMMARDGLHFNWSGQDELARQIFAHCKSFLV